MLAESGKLDRRELTAALLKDRGDMVCIAGLGAPAWDITAVGDCAENLPLWGGMGGAAMIGLGLALAQPRRKVLVLTGDGEMLMGIGALATIAVQAPRNLSIVVQDNEHYGETGMQQTHTGRGVDLPAMAAAAGFRKTATVYSQAEFEAAVPLLLEAPGPVFVSLKVTTDPVPNVLPPRDGAWLKHRFRQALMGDAAFK